MIQMRTLPEAARELVEADPQTRLTLPVLRRMVKSGQIPAVYSGKRALIDISKLGEYLERAGKQPEMSQSKIRMLG